MVENGTGDLYGRMLALGKIRPLSREGNMACGIFLCIIAVLGLLGNWLVVVVLYRCKKLRRKPHNILLMNMATADILVSIIGYPFTTISAFSGRYVFGSVVCALQGFLTFLLAMVAMTSLVFLSLYRYVAVCRPWHKYRITPAVSKRFLVVIWIYSLFWTVPPLLGWSSYTLETFGIACSVDWTSQRKGDMLYVYCLILFCYVLPTVTMGCCYYCIVQTSYTLRYVQDKVLDIDQAICHQKLTTEVKLSGMCFTMVLFFMGVWSPYTFASLWSMYSVVPVWAAILPSMFAKVASTLNPYIYVVASPDFRGGLRAVLASFRRTNTVNPCDSQVDRLPWNAGMYTIDRTRDGIYIGHRTVVIQSQELAMF